MSDASTELADVRAEIAALQRELDTLTADQMTIEALTGVSSWSWTDGQPSYAREFLDALGCTAEELPGRINPPDVERVVGNAMRFIADPEAQWLKQIIHYRAPDGDSRWFIGSMRAAERKEDGRLRFGVGGQIEVTESMSALEVARNQLEIQTRQLQAANARLEAQTKQLRQANTALEEFAYAASHDLQAPLRAIAHFATWIDEDLPPNCGKQVRGHVKGLLGRVDRMVRLHADLLAYARIAGQTPSIEEARLPRLVRSAWNHNEPPGGFLIDLKVPEIDVRVTEASLRTVLRNLFRNTIVHHDREDGQVVVRATCEEQWLVIRIEDDGPGISLDDAGRIFNALYRAGAGRPGSGMGLAIARRHAVQAGGEVRFVPTDGRGAIFEVRWPLH